MGEILVTASTALALTSSTALTHKLVLTSISVTPLVILAPGVSGYATFYNATAATVNTDFMRIRCGTSGHTITWSDDTGIEVYGRVFYVEVNSATVTLVWK